MITAHLLTKNNADTLEKTLKSVQPWASQIIVIDQGSTDRTLEICENYRTTIIAKTNLNRSELRNYGVNKAKNEWSLMIEPWEVLTKGQSLDRLGDLVDSCYYVSILQAGGVLLKEVRLWRKGCSFVSPVFERIKETATDSLPIMIYSNGRRDYQQLMEHVHDWRKKQPLMPQPYYFEACIHLAEGRWDQFLATAERYMVMMPHRSEMSAVMNRYHYALVQLTHRKNARVAIQNLILCLIARPLMAEFWCLLGDVHYHLLSQFEKARSFYENALVLGHRRLQKDWWPMDISKYKEYPQMMVDSCNKILGSTGLYVSR